MENKQRDYCMVYEVSNEQKPSEKIADFLKDIFKGPKQSYSESMADFLKDVWKEPGQKYN